MSPERCAGNASPTRFLEAGSPQSGRRKERPALRLSGAGIALLLLFATPVGIAAESPYDHSPVTYRIDSSNLTLSTFWYRVEARQAFTSWNDDAAGRLPYDVTLRPAADGEQADITLWFRNAPIVGETCNNSTLALGCAATIDEGKHWNIEIKMQREDGAYYSYRLIGDVLRHEVGHALFLPHSDDPRDIMYHALDTSSYALAQPVSNWRPVVIGVVGLIVAIVLGSVLVIRQFRSKEIEYGPLDPACDHELERKSIIVNGEWAWCEACEKCRGARPIRRE